MAEGGHVTLCGAKPTEKWIQGDDSHVCTRCQAAQEAAEDGSP